MTDNPGNQTNISGTVIGPVLSGTFSGPVTIQTPRSLPLKYRTIVNQMVEDYSEVFGGRDAEFAALDQLLTDPVHSYGLLIAPTGRGKTALLIQWAARMQCFLSKTED